MNYVLASSSPAMALIFAFNTLVHMNARFVQQAFQIEDRSLRACNVSMSFSVVKGGQGQQEFPHWENLLYLSVC